MLRVMHLLTSNNKCEQTNSNEVINQYAYNHKLKGSMINIEIQIKVQGHTFLIAEIQN
jgi:hypothetical protein